MIRPLNVTVREGEYGHFSCEVPCFSVVFWFVGDLFNSTPLPLESVDEIMFTRTESSCNQSGKKIANINILATPNLDRAAVQCSIADAPGCESILYSRFRLLNSEFSYLFDKDIHFSDNFT